MTLGWSTNAEDPNLEIWWTDDAGDLIDFSSGYTWSLKIGPHGGAALITKTTGIVGAAGAGTAPTGTPNVVVTWAAGELNITPGRYRLELTPTLTSRQRDPYVTSIEIRAVLT